MCCGRRRYVVVFMGFLGLLVCIGSRAVFTMVITHVIAGQNLSLQENELPVCVSLCIGCHSPLCQVGINQIKRIVPQSEPIDITPRLKPFELIRRSGR